MQVRHHAGGEDRHVVPALENADDSPLSMGLGHPDDLLGDGLEVLDFEAEIADGVLGMGVEPGADQDELGLDLVCQGMESGAKGGMVLGLGRAVG